MGQQRQLGLAQAKCVELQNETQRAQQELQLAHREHEEYKLRAAGILQVGSCISQLHYIYSSWLETHVHHC